MAPSGQRYAPVPPIPTYDEAVAAGSRTHFGAEDHDEANPAEGESLLAASSATTRSRRPAGYHRPTVETDDEDSDGDSDMAEAAYVRREMQELEIDDGDEHSGRSRSSLWGKRIGFSLPQWSWKWRLPRIRIQLGRQPSDGSAGSEREEEPEASGPRFPRLAWRKWNPTVAFIVMGRLLAIVLVFGLLYLLFMSDLFTNMARRMGQQFEPESVRQYLQGQVSSQNMRNTLKHFTSYAHLAGSEGDYALAVDIKNLFLKHGLDEATVDEYYVYLNYPQPGGRAVQVLGNDGQPEWSAKIEEEDTGAETAGHQTYAFHAHSKEGDVKGPLMYVNYGSREDFKVLYDSGIDTKGAIALVRQGGSQPDSALKVKAAELAGFAGVLVYTDPADEGFVKGAVAPNGRYYPADAVERGSVSLSSWVLGDPLTPGWESLKLLPRLKIEDASGLAKIPSMPLAWRDAQFLLQTLKGSGQRVPDHWVGRVPDVPEWWTGDLKTSRVVRIKNEQDANDKQPIWNVYGRIEGIEQAEKSIIIGNHRDSLAFGAGGPHSGTAVMIELVRIFGDLVTKGWRPLRTIYFMSWDAGEYNMAGSTEFVEKNLEGLKRDAFAYINLDAAVTGDTFHAAGSPVFQKLLLQVLKRVSDPNFNTTLRDLWDRRNDQLEGFGATSDYAGFQDIAGTASLDLRFDGEGFPHHSSYDNFEWMDRIGDPEFVYHNLMGQVVGLMVLELAERSILPFDLGAYADKLKDWVNELWDWSGNKGANVEGNAPFDLTWLREAADDVWARTHEFAQWELRWETTVLAASGWEPLGLGRTRCEYNSRMARFDSDLLDDDGIPGRKQFKHVVFGPELWDSRQPAYFPGIRDAVTSGDWDLANKTVERVTALLKRAAAKLEG